MAAVGPLVLFSRIVSRDSGAGDFRLNSCAMLSISVAFSDEWGCAVQPLCLYSNSFITAYHVICQPTVIELAEATNMS